MFPTQFIYSNYSVYTIRCDFFFLQWFWNRKEMDKKRHRTLSVTIQVNYRCRKLNIPNMLWEHIGELEKEIIICTD